MKPAPHNPSPGHPLHSHLATRLALLGIILLTWLSVAAGPPVWKSNHDYPVGLTLGQIEEARTVSQGPPKMSRAGVMLDTHSDTLLLQWNASQSLPMA